MFDDLLNNLDALFVTVRNLITIGMSWTLTLFIGKILPIRWLKIYKLHISPAIMLIICSAAVWVPGLRPGFPEEVDEVAGIDGSEIGWRIALGVLLALGSYIVPIVVMWAAEKYLPLKVVKQIRKIFI